MNRIVSGMALVLMLGTAAMAQNAPSGQVRTPAAQSAPGTEANIMTSLPVDAMTVTNFYK